MENTKKVSSLQLGVLTFFLAKASIFPIASSIILNYSKQNIWYCILISGLIGLIPLFIYLYINNINNELNIIELNQKLFGKILGGIINFIISIGILLFGVIILLGLCNFTFSNYLTNIPQIIIGFLFMIVVSYGAIKGIETICRTSQLLFILNLILFTISVGCLIYYIDINNFKPIFDVSITNIFKSSYNYVLFCVTPIFMLSIIPNDIIVKSENYNKSIIIGYISSVIFILLSLCSTVGVLGNLTTLFEYPEYIALTQIEYFHFFERVENLLSLQWIFDVFVFMIMILYFLKKYISVTFNVKKKKSNNVVVFILSLLILLTTSIFFTNSIVIKNFIINNYFYIMLLSFVIIPFIIFLRIKFKRCN